MKPGSYVHTSLSGWIPAAEGWQPVSLLHGSGAALQTGRVVKIMISEECKTENTSSCVSIDPLAKGLALDI